MRKEFKHKTKLFRVSVDTKRGKPIVTKQGFVKIISPDGNYRGCELVKDDIFLEEFENV